MLIDNFQLRLERASTNENHVLVTLRVSKFSDAKTLSISMDKSVSYAYKLLKRLEKRGLVKKHHIDELNMNIWGLTEQGLLRSWGVGEEIVPVKRFEPSKVSTITVFHELQLQKAGAQAIKSGWSEWLPGHQLPVGLQRRPDAVVKSLSGKTVAVELERTIKSRKRYEAIISDYLQAIKRDEYDYVAYVVPDKLMALRMPLLFRSIKSVPVSGKRVSLEERHYTKFSFYSLENWPKEEVSQ